MNEAEWRLDEAEWRMNERVDEAMRMRLDDAEWGWIGLNRDWTRLNKAEWNGQHIEDQREF